MKKLLLLLLFYLVIKILRQAQDDNGLFAARNRRLLAFLFTKAEKGTKTAFMPASPSDP